MKKFLLFIWQFPQHLAALLFITLGKATKKRYGLITYYEVSAHDYFSGVSLGQYIIIPRYDKIPQLNCVLLHENGHSKQSLILGPLYLIVIGFYSLVFCNLWDRWFHKKWTIQKRQDWYYSRWCEAWADRLGGVVR